VPRADKLATFIYRLSKNFGSLKLLEPSGPVQACTGIALPLPFIYIYIYIYIYICMLEKDGEDQLDRSCEK
jgi:hypothetical protein